MALHVVTLFGIGFLTKVTLMIHVSLDLVYPLYAMGPSNENNDREDGRGNGSMQNDCACFSSNEVSAAIDDVPCMRIGSNLPNKCHVDKCRITYQLTLESKLEPSKHPSCWCDGLCRCDEDAYVYSFLTCREEGQSSSTQSAPSAPSSEPTPDDLTTARSTTVTPSTALSTVVTSSSTPLEADQTMTSTTRISTTLMSATSMLPSRNTETNVFTDFTSINRMDPSKQTSTNIGIGVAIGIICGIILIAATTGLIYCHKKSSHQSDIGVGIYSDPGKIVIGSSQNVVTNPSYDNTIEGTSGQVSILTTAPTRNLSPKAGQYSEPEFALPRVTSPEDINIYTYAEGYRGQKSPAPSGGEYVDIDGSNFTQKTSLEGRVDGEYSVLQNPSKDASGSNDYDLLNHQRSTGVVIVTSDDHEYGKLSSD